MQKISGEILSHAESRVSLHHTFNYSSDILMPFVGWPTPSLALVLSDTQACMHACMCTHARTHARAHTHTDTSCYLPVWPGLAGW